MLNRGGHRTRSTGELASCASATARSWRSTSTRPRPALAREDEAADELIARAARAGEGRGPVGAAPAAGGGRHRAGLPRLRVPERGDRPQSSGRSSSSTARRRTPATARSCTCSAPTSRRSAGCGRSSRARSRSFFSMTEPEVSGSDPTGLRTRAVRDGDEWVIDGHKWFSSGAEGAGVRDRDGGHRPGRRAAPARRRRSSFRPTRRASRSSPCRLRATAAAAGRRTARSTTPACACRSRTRSASAATASGSRRSGSGPGRIHHVMRWLGQMQRAFELLCSLRARARGVRRAARRQADGPELDRRLRGRDPGVPADDARRRAQDRRGRRGARRDLADQVLRGAGPERGDRPRDPGARRARPHRPHAAGDDVRRMRARRPDLRRPGRGPPHGRQPADPEGVRGRRRHGGSGRHANRRVTLASRPVGFPTEDDFAVDESRSASPARARCSSASSGSRSIPYQRGRMSTQRSYAKGLELGDVMTAQALGEVVESQRPPLLAGRPRRRPARLAGLRGRARRARCGACRRSSTRRRWRCTPSARPAFTAYFGLLDVGRPKPGDTVVVSGAAGAVGQIVGQIAKIAGCRTVGIAGGPEKCKECQLHGYDVGDRLQGRGPARRAEGGVPRRRRRVLRQRRRRDLGSGRPAAERRRPDRHLRPDLAVQPGAARADVPPGRADRLPRADGGLPRHRLRPPLRRGGRCAWRAGSPRARSAGREHVTDGLENAPKAFIGMLNGENRGKALVKVADRS